MQNKLTKLGFQIRQVQGVTFLIPPVIEIPAGAFLMGTSQENARYERDSETPQMQIQINHPYKIGKYPVTVAEYAYAVQAQAVEEPEACVDGLEIHNYTWKYQLQFPLHPVIGVNWFQAKMYCVWLTELTGKEWRLPSEAEWEKAARGTDGRKYPWGNEWDDTKANSLQKGSLGLTPVYQYPEGASPYGVMDMVANADQWCNTMYKRYPYDAEDGRETQQIVSQDPRSDSLAIVLRGGSWMGGSGCRCAQRIRQQPIISASHGFRLVYTIAK